jgi:hypothetical protein
MSEMHLLYSIDSCINLCITFAQYSDHGGWNNIRMAMGKLVQYIVHILCHSTYFSHEFLLARLLFNLK